MLHIHSSSFLVYAMTGNGGVGWCVGDINCHGKQDKVEKGGKTAGLHKEKSGSTFGQGGGNSILETENKSYI